MAIDARVHGALSQFLNVEPATGVAPPGVQKGGAGGVALESDLPMVFLVALN